MSGLVEIHFIWKNTSEYTAPSDGTAAPRQRPRKMRVTEP
jgi:hypothetical protein